VSKKKTALDILGETHLPADLLTPTLGTTFGLDGFPDLDYGAGLLDQFFPDPHQSGLPDGVVKSADEGFGDLGDFMKEGNLADLDWLETAEQDPDRLPDSPVNKGIPELEQAWGLDRRTDGRRVEAYDREEILYRQAAEDTSTRRAPKLSRARLTEIVRKAMRRSAAGVPLDKLLKEAAIAAGDDAEHIKKAMQVVRAEHGLAGKVFIRAEAYPGYEQGRWNKHLKQAAAGARFILVAEKNRDAAIHAEGICTITGKRVVTKVPWKAAYLYYAPRFDEAVKKQLPGFATSPKSVVAHPHGTPEALRARLRRAFLFVPEAEAPNTSFPKHTTPSERVSSDEAREVFANAEIPERKVYDRRAQDKAQAHQAAAHQINAWVHHKLLSDKAAQTIIASGVSAPTMLKQAAAVVLQSKGASAFSGLANDFTPSRATLKEAHEALAAVEPLAPIIVSHRPGEAKRKQANLQVAKLVTSGSLSKADGVRLVKSTASPRDILRAASDLVAAKSLQSGDYSGVSNSNRVTKVSRKEALDALARAEEAAHHKQIEVDVEVQKREHEASRKGRAVRDLEARCAKVASAVEKGLRGESLARAIRRTITAKESTAASLILASMMRQRGLSLEKALNPTGKQAKSYDGPQFKVAQVETPVKAPPRQEIQGMLRWALQKMNEGLAGSDLDALLSARFSKASRKVASTDLRDLRAQHEGLAGFLYVDAVAYATKTGMAGCEKGATQHRANAIPTVMQMDRCVSCTRRNAKADGTPVCQVYNKPLVTASDLPVDDIKAYQQKSIKAADASDAELTASLFAPVHEQAEYNLHGVTADEIGFDDSPDAEDLLNGVVFGGMEW